VRRAGQGASGGPLGQGLGRGAEVAAVLEALKDTKGKPIPVDTAVSIADQLIETGEVTTPYPGVGTIPLTPEVAERFDLPVDSGELVQIVEPGSGAEVAGVRRGDVITALDGTEISSYGDLLSTLRDYEPGDTVGLTVVRNGEERTLDVTLGEGPR
jgi:serine protease Do